MVFSLDFTSRTAIRALFEQMRIRSTPIFHGLHRRLAFQRRLRKLMVVQDHVTQQRLLRILALMEAMRLAYIADAEATWAHLTRAGVALHLRIIPI